MIVRELGIAKSTIHGVIERSRAQSVQHPVQPKLQISINQHQEKAQVRSPAKPEIGSPGPTRPWPEFYQEAGESDPAITGWDAGDEFNPLLDWSRPHPRPVVTKTRPPPQTWEDIAEQERYRIFQKHGLADQEIRRYCDVFRTNERVIFDDIALVTSLKLAFGEASGALAAYSEFKAIRPKLIRAYMQA